MALCCGFSLTAQAQSCQQLADQLEWQLLQQPHDLTLQQAWQALAHCQDAPLASQQPLVQHKLAYTLGHETNPSYGAGLNQLDLTTPDGVIALALKQAHPSAYFNQLHYQYARQGVGHQQLAQLQLRSYDQAAIHNQYYAAYDWQQTPTADAPSWQASIKWLDSFGVQLAQSSLGYHYPLSPQWAALGELRLKRYTSRTELDGNLALLGLQWQSQDQRWWARWLTGSDRATGFRAGGDQWIHEWMLGWRGDSLQVYAYGRQQQDSQGYSPWLSYNRTRHIQLAGLLLNWQLPSWQGLTPVLQWEASEQSANIPLFQWRNQALKLALQWYW